jgi:4-hydroxy-tetrahydrodipicolinate reductase
VFLGGTGETITISHNTLSPSAYESGILLALAAARTITGVTVGLDQIVDLGFDSAAAPATDSGASR